MRVLCLRGYASSAHAFSTRHLKPLCAATVELCELDCKDGPCKLEGGRGNQRCWFRFSPAYPMDRVQRTYAAQKQCNTAQL